MIFAYGFMFFAIGIAIYPFMVDQIPERNAGKPELYERYRQGRMDAPISVLLGCASGTGASVGAAACRREGDEAGARRLS